MQVVVGAALVRQGRLLAARRPPGSREPGWELPGGKVEPGEEPGAALVREIGEELGCVVRVGRWLVGESPVRPGLVLRVALVDLVFGEPTPREHDALLWLSRDRLDAVTWLPADRLFLAALRSLLESSVGPPRIDS